MRVQRTVEQDEGDDMAAWARRAGSRRSEAAFLRAAARRWGSSVVQRGAVGCSCSSGRDSRTRFWLAASSWQGAGREQGGSWQGAVGEGHTRQAGGDPPNWLFAEPTGWIVGPVLIQTQPRSEHIGGLLDVAGGRDQGCKLIVVLLMA